MSKGDRAERDGSVRARSIRKRLTYPRHRKLRRSDHKLVRKPKNPEALLSQSAVALFVSKALLWHVVARSIDLDSEPIFETDEVEDVVAERNLPLGKGFAASLGPDPARGPGRRSVSGPSNFRCGTFTIRIPRHRLIHRRT